VQKRKRNTVLRVGVALLPPPQAALARGSICPCHATEYWTRRSGQLATPPKSHRATSWNWTPLHIFARDMRCSSVHMTQANHCPQRLSPRLGDFKPQGSPFPQSRAASPRDPLNFLLRCVRSAECLQPVCMLAPPMPFRLRCQLASTTWKSHACRNTERRRHSSGWLGLTQGEIVRGLM
jgi:hypothetical protein